MTNLVQRAIDGNNEGAQLLTCGNITGALRAFHSAVTLMKQAVADVITVVAPNLGRSWSFFHPLVCFGTKEQSHLKGLRSGVSYMYARPLMLSSDLMTLSHFNSAVHTATTCVIFNFALAYHQLGNISGQEACLDQAEVLYDLVLKVLASDVSNNDRAIHHVLCCLALNNLGHLHYKKCNYSTSLVCMQTLYFHYVTTGCLDDSILTDREVEEILMNLVHVRPPAAASAA